MDTHVKRGEVYLQHQKYSEKWKRYWLNLYPNSRNGVARLALTETGPERSPVIVRKQLDRKIIRLADCISVVRLPPHAEALPGDSMAAFCVDTGEKRLVFAVEKEGCGEWLEKICEIAFQKSSNNVPQPLLQMEENEIYASREEVFEFPVTVQQTEASVRCNLQGTYWLQIGEDMLMLKGTDSKQRVMEWPYKLLRRYGGDKMTFSIEAGRRCDSGPGTFIYETKQGDEILHHMELAIQQQKSLAVTGGSSTVQTPCSPLPKRPGSGNLLDIHTNSYSDSSLSPMYSSPVSPIGSAESECIKPVTGSSQTTQRHSGESTSLPEIVYSNPVDAVGFDKSKHTQRVRSQVTVKSSSPGDCHNEDLEPVYSDPVDLLQPTYNPPKYASVNLDKAKETFYYASQSEPVYSEIPHFTPYPAQKHGSVVQIEEEPIYSLPEVCVVHKTQEDVHTSPAKDNKQNTQSTRTEEVIYSQVKKPKKSTKPQDKYTITSSQEIMSEDLGLI
ncbi:docking protein 2 [Ictalurus punctatus]|uniref:Docking protein 2 n=1 Tax=Ictalurus punctatus TaxID=7998 RepID=A0A2D0QLP8_ICTPU|nr:docking protein 2 [Ictalurus punctatus]